MSIDKKNIAIYSNLPSGGASEMAKVITKYLSSKFVLKKITDNDIRPGNLIAYISTAVFILPSLHKKLASEIDSDNDLLICHHSWITKSPHLLRYSKLRKIYFCHEGMREYYDKEFLKIQSFREKIINAIRLPVKIIDKQNLRAKNLTVVVNSKFSKSNIEKYYKISDCKVLYPGINTDVFSYMPRKVKKNQVISVGAINKLKGYELLIQSVSLVKKNQRPDLVIVGNGLDGEYLKKIRRLATDLEVTLKVKLNLSKRSLVHEYNKSKMFLYSPVSEPFGIVIEEAMSCGLPVIAYKYGGGYSEIMSNKNGYLLPSLNPRIWAEKIERLLNSPKTIDRIARYNSNYLRENFSENIMNNKILNLIKSL